MKICEIIGHKFKPRYHRTEAPYVSNLQSFKAADPDYLFEKQYVRDVCERCGLTIEGPNGRIKSTT